MDDSGLEAIKARTGYRKWRGRNTLGESLFVRNYAPRPRALPALEPVKVRRITLPGMPPCVHSIWRSQENPDSLLSLMTYELPSREAAHEFLVRLLGESQTGMFEPWRERPAGDVGFVPPHCGASAFARANLVFWLAPAARAPVDAPDLARLLDADLIARPTPPRSAQKPALMAVEPPPQGTRAAGRAMALRGLAREATYKFFSPTGEISEEQGEVVYRSASSKPASITVYEEDERGNVLMRSYSQPARRRGKRAPRGGQEE